MVCGSFVHLALAKSFASMDSIIRNNLSEDNIFISCFTSLVALTYVGPNYFNLP